MRRTAQEYVVLFVLMIKIPIFDRALFILGQKHDHVKTDGKQSHGKKD